MISANISRTEHGRVALDVEARAAVGVLVVAEVAEHLHLRFGTDEWKATHIEKKVNEFGVGVCWVIIHMWG